MSSSSSPPSAGSFQELFCAQYGVSPDRFEATILRLTLYPHARWLADVKPHAWLAPDCGFIAAVGRLTRGSGFAAEALEFQSRPENQRFWRRDLRLRVSVHRMRVLFSEVMGGTPVAADRQRYAEGERGEPPGSLAAG
jgi:hypothetical protein